MNYVQGFVTPVPTANKEKYLKQASDAVQLFKQFGVKRQVEGWGEVVRLYADGWRCVAAFSPGDGVVYVLERPTGRPR